MGKTSGGTRGSSASSPRGLSNVRTQINTAIANGGANWGNTELVQLRIREEAEMKKELDALAGENGWKKGFNNLTKEYDGDSPVKIMEVSVTAYGSGIEKGPYYQARVGGASSVLGNSKYTDEINSLWNNDKQFKTAKEAVRWADTQANRINKKYKSRI